MKQYFSWKLAGAFAVTYIFLVAHAATMTIGLLLLCAYTFRGPVQALQALTLLGIVRASNPAFTGFSPYASQLFWLVLLAACAVLITKAIRLPKGFLNLLTFYLVAVITSVFASAAVDVSLMKATSFFLVAASILIASESLQRNDVVLLQRWYVSQVLVVLLLSLLTLAIPSVAYGWEGGGLRGVFNHPQAFAVFLAPFAAWLLVQTAISKTGTHNLLRWVLVFVLLAVIVATKARTAMLATFLSVVLATFFHMFKGGNETLRRSRGQILAFAAFGILGLGIFAATGGLSDLVRDLVFKGSRTETIGEAFEESRGAGIAAQLENFAERPFTGVGFGVYEFGVFGGEERVVRVFGIPLSAPAEKGFAFTAVLEETGIFGALLFYSLLLGMIRVAFKDPAPETAALMLGAVFVNFGEAVIFSPGGLGLYVWIVIGLALAQSRTNASSSKVDLLAGRP